MRAALLACVAGCQSFAGGGGGGDDPLIDAPPGGGSGSVSVFDPSITHVVVEIDYETGQQPYTGPIVGFGDTFEPTVTNLNRLFAGKKNLTIPTAIAAMQDVGSIPDEELTVQDILDLAAAHRDARNTATTRTYYMIFVSGYFADATGPKTSVLGVSIGDTIAMFKDVIRTTDVIGLPNVVRYVEQATIVHELAHSIGLVDNGVPMAAAHKDTAHGAHCDNKDCVMYWLNEGASDAMMFAREKLLAGSTILFDAQCLADVDAQSGGN